MLQDVRLVATILATIAAGCKSTEDYKKFAAAGNNFAKANNTLLNSAEDIAINTTSERILSERITQVSQPTEDIIAVLDEL
ncbi:hypothetical protein NIES2101_35745 [Calothrix sp. HK-06]|nr:hypothetical protein NIES2101_35745 [Calothrix sp. HK-06]